MKRRACRRSRSAAWATLALAVLAASCVLRPRPDPTRFYVLTASAPDSSPTPGSLVVGLGPLTMSGHLQHPLLATRVDGTQIRYADFDRWAEPLPTLFARTLGRDLSAGLGGARIVTYPWYRTTPLDVVVQVDVRCFEADTAGNVKLDACWNIRDTHTGSVRVNDCSSITETVDEPGPQAQVAALSRTVAELARRVAGALR
ncbi:MAG TPA: PqiC family protein [Candidatus Binatia bacterium]|nr:PqiC family protein [Candidatus Binatia bacterium]